VNQSEARAKLLTDGSPRLLVCGAEDPSKFEEGKDSALADWTRVRSMIEHEDRLIHQRTTWLININAFLFTAFFFSQKGDNNEEIKGLAYYFAWLLPCVGIVVSSSILVAVMAAMRQLKLVANWWKWRKALDPRNYLISPDDRLDLRHPQVIGFQSKQVLPHDFMITKVLPGVVLVCWILILLAVLRKTLSQDLTVPAWMLLAVSVFVAIGSIVMALWVVVRSKDEATAAEEIRPHVRS